MYSEPRLRPVSLNAAAQAACASLPLAPALPALRVGMIGLGTVGMGTWSVLQRNQSLIAARAGRGIELVALAVRDRVRAAEKLGDAALGNVELTSDPHYVATHPDIDVLVEVAGGTGPAHDWVQAALAAGKHVVTANKALLATHGEALAASAATHGRQLAYEAAVAGSIPIIKTLREALAANRIDAVAGILNGTSNYILTRMRDAGLDFEQALAEAQALGYAEADPTFDVDGIDAAHKLTLLAANAFGVPVNFDAVHVEGIRDLQRADIAAAAELGYAVKLLAVARRRGNALELRVHPALVDQRNPLAHIHGATNGVSVHGDASGAAFYSGAGAGASPRHRPWWPTSSTWRACLWITSAAAVTAYRRWARTCARATRRTCCRWPRWSHRRCCAWPATRACASRAPSARWKGRACRCCAASGCMQANRVRHPRWCCSPRRWPTPLPGGRCNNCRRTAVRSCAACACMRRGDRQAVQD